ncbi:MAG: hypothetical protein Q9187_006771, partial [Circinaria calcarea]
MALLGHDYSNMLFSRLSHIKKLELVDGRQRYARASWVSLVTLHEAIPEDMSVAYWRANLESPVRFFEAITNMVGLEGSPVDVLIKVAPHPALTSPLDQ